MEKDNSNPQDTEISSTKVLQKSLTIPKIAERPSIVLTRTESYHRLNELDKELGDLPKK